MKNTSKKGEDGLTSYGRQVLSYFYKRHKHNTEFKSEDDFIEYAIEKGYKDTLEVGLEEEVLGLTKDNLQIALNTTHLRKQQIGIYKDRSELTYGDKVNLTKEISAELKDVATAYNTLLYYLELVDCKNKEDTVEPIKMYLINGQRNLRKIEDILKKIEM